MSRLLKTKRLVLERANRRILGESEMDCPKETKNSDLNEKNKKKIVIEHQYGEQTEEAKEKGQNCGNCVAFDISKRMKDCVGDNTGQVGYCWMHQFMCSGKKWCNTWVEGGPIKEDSTSYKKQG